MRLPPSGYFHVLLLTFLGTLLQFSHAQNWQPEITEDLEAQVKQRLIDSAYFSWELGVMTQVLIEYDVPTLSVFTPGSIPPNLTTLPIITDAVSNQNDTLSNKHAIYNTTLLTPIFTHTQTIVSSLTQSYNGTIPTNIAQPLVMNDGAAADPASLGIAVLLFNYTGWGGTNWANAAQNQLNYLLYDTPRTGEGAISHRSEEVQLWSDFIYMVPPFLAYYGVLTKNRDLVYEAYNQIRLYRTYMPGDHKLWRHIIFGGRIPWDTGLWATGNGWFCLGTLKVMATIMHSQYADEMNDEISDMTSWVLDVQEGMVRALDNSTFLFTNYLSVPPKPSKSNFHDAASSALFSYTVYVLSNLLSIHTYIPEAEKIRQEISSYNDDGSDQQWKHFDNDGYLTPVVNPRAYGEQGEKSPEGQAFVLGMQAAYKEWVRRGSLAPPARPVGVPDSAPSRWKVHSFLWVIPAFVVFASEFSIFGRTLCILQT
ncbi:Six-hairpin glycosidase-like protein [Flagelloscypha sp. PMI_526]|nr:Six-hairpin glycosidase-like protein [Flagelloscypha sp. PMI_526]